MSIRIIALLFFSILICISAQAKQKPLNIVVSVAPQKYLLQKIVGPHANVSVMIEPGQTPATWEPSPRRMTQMAETEILFGIGVPFEEVWLPRLQANFPDLIIVDPRPNIELLSLPKHTDSHNSSKQDIDSHAQEGIDPHIWLDPIRDIQLAKNMTQTLCQHDPDQCSSYHQGLDELVRELTQLDQELADLLQPYAGCQFMVFHPSWGYFAQRYHLHQLAIELEGKEPRGAKLAQLAQTAQADQINTIFIQQQFSQKAAATIAEQINASIVPLDPLAEDLPSTLRTTAQQLKAALETSCRPSSH